ncbi:ABC-type multidrug transport system, ATPase and permease component [Acetitomaculum ruminis DSM 5522]|uniref:ABC-type multidrug transport system, ATPase and permease component n=1 Tax=Acetitomaculum ruminis DSM 5522 TaxID=1120918 RepID=A0A1I0WE48_9FIRM|nr:ABC transporter ATP-binding protein [Acetitomaculum ruminis]SFA86687.1 ABC-type multidrug transport system, ATPase and permease component [Acetitomaculum ruminis DSM 5522]
MNIKENVLNLSKTIKPYGKRMSLAIISSLLKQASIIGCTAITAYMVGLAMEHKLIGVFNILLIELFLCIIARALFFHLEMYFAHDVAFRTIRDFRLSIYKKLNELAPAYTARKQTGQIAQNFVGDVEILELFLAHTFSSFIVAAIVAAVLFFVLITISSALAFVLLIFTVLLAMVPYLMKKRAGKQGKEVRKYLADNNSLLMETVQGLREIIMLNSKDLYRNRINKSMEDLYDSQKKYGERKGLESMMNHVLTGFFTVIVMLVAAFLVSKGALEIELYPVAVMLSTVILNPAMEVAVVAQEMGIVFSASNRIQNLYGEKPVVNDFGNKEIIGDNLSISFENVNFSYEFDKPVLKNISFDIKPGENVAIIGESGVGKTTCANLLLRYYDCESGAVKINGVNIKKVKMESLREKISAVQQENYLFHESIADNISLGVKNASKDDIIKAAKMANAHDFIMDLPKGYDTIAGERGYKLSGGQRQRIAIARTILKNTPIVIFDEALSSLDTENEQYIQDMLQQYMAGKSIMTIAHRISTIKAADKVVMLRNGEICAIGNHEELLLNNKHYRQLIAMKDF